jgi:hypothetical protein
MGRLSSDVHRFDLSSVLYALRARLLIPSLFPPSILPSLLSLLPVGYDIQYFLGTLTPVLDSLHGLDFYYVYKLTLTFLQPCSFTTAQDRSFAFLPVLAPFLPSPSFVCPSPCFSSFCALG